jgi:uncharacterized protein (UPF0332 family)
VSARATDLWCRAKKALAVAEVALSLDPDSAASRAYYAAFFAVSARFALEGKAFAKHSALEAAVHRDLVKTQLWPVELGQAYSRLSQVRSIGDYGEIEHVSEARAKEAIDFATDILKAVAKECPQVFSFP